MCRVIVREAALCLFWEALNRFETKEAVTRVLNER